MKQVLVLLCLALLALSAFKLNTGTVLAGKITDQNGEVLVGVNIRVTKGTTFIKGAVSDAEGKYRVELEPGAYDVEFSYTGFESKRVLDINVQPAQETTLDMTLHSGALLEEVVVVGHAVKSRREASRSEAVTYSEKKAAGKKEESRSAKKKAAPTTAAKPAPTPAKRGDPSRSEPIAVTYDDASPTPAIAKDELSRESESVVLYEVAPSDDATTGKPVPAPGRPGQPAPRAGLLTAGEWNDLHNWNKHWLDLQADGEIDAYQKMYGFYPNQRYTLLLQNEQELPVTDAAVQLLDQKGTTVWEARTDNMGRAELWNGLNGQATTGNLTLQAWVDGEKHKLGAAKPFAEGLNRHKIQRVCKHAQNLDIVWAVDATGSMGDELEYLKTELLDVIGSVKAVNPDLAVRMGSVFYRDKGDEYIAKSSALNHDIAKTVDYIRKQFAGGGGDYPEAVHSALEEAIYRQPWSTEAVARICFLVLDASPHQEPAVLESLQKSIREAAKKGIRIVPVSASGIQKDTEFLMKFFGLATNGSYVFLTDHSGIGGKHLEPTTDEYKVEQLNDLLVRLITEYTAVPSCEGKSTIRFHDQQAQSGQQQGQGNGQSMGPIVYYPNPASHHFTLELPFDADKVTLYDAEGKAVRSLAQLSAGTHTVPVNDLNEGFYTLRIWKGGQVQSGKVVVVRA